MPMKDFRDLVVWEKAHGLTMTVYQETARFPAEERYGLVAQLRRAAISVPANIAEGCGRRGDREFARFLEVAMGSASELEYEILLARDLGMLGTEGHADLERRVIEVKRMLAAFIGKLRMDGDERTSGD
jgi:four helix bundle protein